MLFNINWAAKAKSEEKFTNEKKLFPFKSGKISTNYVEVLKLRIMDRNKCNEPFLSDSYSYLSHTEPRHFQKNWNTGSNERTHTHTHLLSDTHFFYLELTTFHSQIWNYW